MEKGVSEQMFDAFIENPQDFLKSLAFHRERSWFEELISWVDNPGEYRKRPSLVYMTYLLSTNDIDIVDDPSEVKYGFYQTKCYCKKIDTEPIYFCREIWAHYLLLHPACINIVAFDFSKMLLLTPYCNQGNMESFQFSSFEEKIKLLYTVLKALKHFHDCDLIHRDIKPSNVFIERNGFCMAYLSDFGISRPVMHDKTTSNVKSEDYCHPEYRFGGDSFFYEHKHDYYSMLITIIHSMLKKAPTKLKDRYSTAYDEQSLSRYRILKAAYDKKDNLVYDDLENIFKSYSQDMKINLSSVDNLLRKLKKTCFQRRYGVFNSTILSLKIQYRKEYGLDQIQKINDLEYNRQEYDTTDEYFYLPVHPTMHILDKEKYLSKQMIPISTVVSIAQGISIEDSEEFLIVIDATIPNLIIFSRVFIQIDHESFNNVFVEDYVICEKIEENYLCQSFLQARATNLISRVEIIGDFNYSFLSPYHVTHHNSIIFSKPILYVDILPYDIEAIWIAEKNNVNQKTVIHAKSMLPAFGVLKTYGNASIYLLYKNTKILEHKIETENGSDISFTKISVNVLGVMPKNPFSFQF